MERRIDDQRPSAPLEWEAKHAAMDRAGELPLERRIAERRKEPPALVTVMASTIVALKEQVSALQAALDSEAAAPTRLDVMSLIHSQMYRVYASAIDREDIDTKYMREIEDAIMGIYHGRYISGYDLRKSEEALATTRPSALLAMQEEALRAAMRKAYNLGQTYWQQADSDSVKHQNKASATRDKFNQLANDTCAILAASSGAVAVPEGGAA